MSFAPLDPVLHAPLRLAIVSVLLSVDSADFNHLLEATQSTRGNLSVQLTKLKEAGYIEINKSFRNNYPHTDCRITPAGKRAFEVYLESLQSYLPPHG